MDPTSGGLSDEQRSKGEYTARIIDPKTWRILDAGPSDCFIPLSGTRRSTALLKEIAERMGFHQGDEVSGDT